MNDARDPQLESLFEAAEEHLVDDGFSSAVQKRMRQRRGRLLLARLAAIAGLVALEVVLESPIQQSLGIVAEVLNTPLIPVEGEWLAFIAAPINSVAGLLAVLLLGLNYLYRKITY